MATDKRQQSIIDEIKDLQRRLNALERYAGTTIFPSYSDSNRPAVGNVGRVIFNTDDGNLNIDNGTNWILPDGTVT